MLIDTLILNIILCGQKKRKERELILKEKKLNLVVKSRLIHLKSASVCH